MVSFQSPLSPKNLDQQTRTISYLESKKRKWDDHQHKIKPSSPIDLHLETPLPSEWQRCLDIESGEIHFYNTKTKKRTIKDPRPSSHMSLDLELNLPCGDHQSNENSDHSSAKRKTLSLFATSKTNSWISPDDEEEEMVAAACKRCHMLVVLCKSSPSCPNCKFMHTLDPSPLPKFMIKPRLGLSCT